MINLCPEHKGWTLRLSDCPVCRELQLKSKLVARDQLLSDIRQDLLDRACEHSNGEKVVGVGSTIWNRIQEALGDE